MLMKHTNAWTVCKRGAILGTKNGSQLGNGSGAPQGPQNNEDSAKAQTI